MKPTGLMDKGKNASIELVREILPVWFQLRTYDIIIIIIIIIGIFWWCAWLLA